jgi:hypothetical protein
LLHGPSPADVLIPYEIDGNDIRSLLGHMAVVLGESGGARLKADIDRFREFMNCVPGASLARLDAAALQARFAR